MKNYWLMKSEPDVYAYWDLVKKGTDMWEGVRNYQARNHIQEMKVGDLAFFYHSNAKPSGIIGIMEIIKSAFPDPTQFKKESEYYDEKSIPEKPKWFTVEVRPIMELKRLISLAEIKALPELNHMALLKLSRLSVSPVRPEEWQFILDYVNGNNH